MRLVSAPVHGIIYALPSVIASTYINGMPITKTASMLLETHLPPNTGTVIGRLRNELQASQSEVAAKVGLDQSRMSRIETGEISNDSDVIRVIDALADLGSNDARRYKEFIHKYWRHVERPDFWNPDAACIELAEETLGQLSDFLDETAPPWPLRRQLERQKTLLLNAAGYLTDRTHQIAFIGDIGVGKSTALSFLYDLLLPKKSDAKLTDRVLLEAGGGGTTICEVHIRRGPEFGIAIQPMPEAELRQMVGDLCAAKWLQAQGKDAEGGDTVGIGRELERAIRNMAGLTTQRRKGPDGKLIRRDQLVELVQRCASEDELRTKVLDSMKLQNRTKRDSWFDPGSGKVAMTWLADIFKSINNGRVRDISLPRRIDLFVPDFAAEQDALQISIIDTKGIDDLPIREDLDTRLRDQRTAVVLCTRFNDAPSLTVRIFLQHMRKTFAERFENGKLSILALPRTGEAMAMKDDAGEFPQDDADGYKLKTDQIARTLGGADDDLAGIPIHFLNVESVEDDPRKIRAAVVHQVLNMRKACATRVRNLCAAIDDLIVHHEAQAFRAAVEEVANQLRIFLESNRELKARKKHAYDAVLKAVDQVRYAATLWASARRNGQYSGLSIDHQIGVGAAQDGLLRCRDWFSGIQMYLKTLKANPDLDLARKTIDEIAVGVDASRTDFLESLQTAGVEMYREPLQKANKLWSSCAREWGRGSGFKQRVRDHLSEWFEKHSDVEDGLEELTHALWEEKVIGPMMRLVEESGGDAGASSSDDIP